MRPCRGCWGTGRDPVSTRRLPCAFCKGRGFNPQPTLAFSRKEEPAPSAAMKAAILETLTEAGLDD